MDPLNPPRSLSSPKPTCAKGGAGAETPSVFQFPAAAAASSSSSLSSQLMSSQKEMELEGVCQGLQKQVGRGSHRLDSAYFGSRVICQCAYRNHIAVKTRSRMTVHVAVDC